MFLKLASKVLSSSIYKVVFPLALLCFSCSIEHEHSEFSPVPEVSAMDFEAHCLQMIEETKDPFWYYRLAKVQFEKQQYDNALKNVSLALTDSIGNIEYAKLKARIFLEKEDYSNVAFIRPLRNKKMTVDQAFYFAELAIRAGDVSLYLDFHNNITNDLYRSSYLQSLRYFHTGEDDRAIEHLNKAMKQNPEDEELQKMYLQMLDKDGKKEAVNQQLRNYKDTSSFFFLKYYGLNLIDLDSVTKAKKYLSKARILDSSNVEINKALANIYFEERDYDNTIKLAQEILRVKNDAKAHYLMAYAHMRKKYYSSAQEHLEQAELITRKDENLYNEILMLERNIRYLQVRRIEKDTLRKEDSIQ